MSAIIKGGGLGTVVGGHWVKDTWPDDVRDQWCFKSETHGNFYVSTDDGLLSIHINCSTERIAGAMMSLGGYRGTKWWYCRIDLGDPDLCEKLNGVWNLFYGLVNE
jgi:hypothetical protein